MCYSILQLVSHDHFGLQDNLPLERTVLGEADSDMVDDDPGWKGEARHGMRREREGEGERLGNVITTYTVLCVALCMWLGNVVITAVGGDLIVGFHRELLLSPSLNPSSSLDMAAALQKVQLIFHFLSIISIIIMYIHCIIRIYTHCTCKCVHVCLIPVL